MIVTKKSCLSYLLTCALMLMAVSIKAQAVKNRVIDSAAIVGWPILSGVTISDNGQYASYQLLNMSQGRNTLIIKSLAGRWSVQYPDATFVCFTTDNKEAIVQRKDSLLFWRLGDPAPHGAIREKGYTIRNDHGSQWLAYLPFAEDSVLVLQDLTHNILHRISAVDQYRWEADDQPLLITSQREGHTVLCMIDVQTGESKLIWKSGEPGGLSVNLNSCRYDNHAHQLCFVVSRVKNGQPESSIWYYRPGGPAAVKLVDEQTNGLEKDVLISGAPEFSANGRWLFFNWQKKKSVVATQVIPGVQVDIYGYRDAELQSQQLRRVNEMPSFTAAIAVTGGSVIQLEQRVDGRNWLCTAPDAVTGDHVVIAQKLNKDFKPSWLANMGNSCLYLVSLLDGSRKLIESSGYPVDQVSFSTQGKQVVYWDARQAGYLSYDMQTGQTINLTRGIRNMFKGPNYINMFGNSLFAQPVSNIKWIEEGKAFLVYNKFDIWKVDPSGKHPAQCMTNDYGAKHHVMLRLVDERKEYSGTEDVLVAGFYEVNKDNGFYHISLNRKGNPQLLTMGPYCYYRVPSQIPQPGDSFSHEKAPVKAKDANVWVVSRETASDYPNYFYTTDWKRFDSLTDIHPERSYNWLDSELVHFRQLDGSLQQGILYMPKDFDPGKKYPVIFNYYERLSYRLHEFPFPEFTNANINIPWFVCRGYLVFTPDITFGQASKKGGKTVGESATNAVCGAAQYLARLPFVDSRHMGIQGHSFGGGETNFIVTHSNLFAAASSAGGTVSDQISAYLGPFRQLGKQPNAYRIVHSENGHEMIGATLWERPDLYFRSSSVFNANKVKTPLLLMHNLEDGQTDWGQSFELYNALRRLGKPVWLLQYDHEGHVLIEKQDLVDFTIRLTQFFDHYLKGVPAPRWLVNGIPASLKGIDQGYDLVPETGK